VDDGSTDESGRIAQSYLQVRYVRHEVNLGLASARNTGITVAQGDYLAFLDDDDLWAPVKLSRQMEVHQRNPEVGYTIVNLEHFIEPRMVPPDWMRDKLLDKAMPGYLPSALVVKRVVFDEIGVFDPSFRYGEDSDWFFRAKDAGVPMRLIPETLLYRRIHDSNMTANAEIIRKNLLKITRISVRRQREENSRK
jgi:glycosyltransferase involved in cell wall biosynthesis